MTRLVRVDELRVGDEIQMPHCESVVVDELVPFGDGRIVVRWWRAEPQKLVNRRRHQWKHPRRGEDEKPIRYSLAALQAINEAIDGRQLGQLVPLEPDELVRLSHREEEPVMNEVPNVPAVIDAELEDEPGVALTLFQTSDPATALARMTETARLLVDVVRSQKLSLRIGGSEYLRVEAWSTLGAMLGVHGVVVWTRPNETGDGFVARVEARTIDGRVVGSAEAECSRSESTWAKRPPYALRSMAQTRATSRALRQPLGAIVTLAGYQSAGAEEMPAEAPARTPAPSDDQKPPSKAQVQRITELIGLLEELDPERDWRAHCREFVAGATGGMSMVDAARLTAELELRIEEAPTA